MKKADNGKFFVPNNIFSREFHKNISSQYIGMLFQDMWT